MISVLRSPKTQNKMRKSGQRGKSEFGFEHNATESHFVANRMFELFPLCPQ